MLKVFGRPFTSGFYFGRRAALAFGRPSALYR